MKQLKKMMALVIAMVMCLAMAVPAMADGPTHQDPEKGSITVKSPIMGAAYTGYRIFDLTISESGDSIAYTIDTASPFYQAVAAYAEATKVTEGEGEDAVTKYALTLTELTTQTVKDGDTVTYAKYAISANTDPAKGPVFDAQHFGQAMQKAINGTPAVTDPVSGEETTPAVPGITVSEEYKIYPDYTDTEKKVVTLSDTDQITFKNTPLGYYLITNEYPKEERKATFDMPAHDDVEARTIELDKNTTNEEIEAIADEYVAATIDDDAVDAYIEENNLKDKLVPAGRDLTTEEWNSVKTQLENSTKQNTIEAIKKSLEAIKQNAADINVKEPVLVFVDSTTKAAEIIEKNELDKWDVPVNPSLGEADLEDLPEHGEPDGGKNIIIGYKDEEVDGQTVKKPIYADWTEANIGDSIHYELRVNAMNFVREDAENLGEDETVNNNSEFNVKQVKEYIIGDYQNDSLTFDPEKDKIKVKIVDDNGNVVVLKDGDEDVPQEWDYTAWSDKFFLSDDKALNEDGTVKDDILANGGGIAIPWALKTTDKDEAAKHKNVTSYELITTEDDPATADVNEEVKTTYYWYSIYDSDVTIVVDYTMTLTDKATIDVPGNVNYSEYGMNFTDKDENEYKPPKPDTPEDRTKPDKDSKKDTATVYTYALAIQKVDENGEKLAGATFKIEGLVVNELDEGYYKVVSYDPESTTDSAELKSDKDGLLVIEGLKASAELTVKEAVAPEGYNILKAPVTMKPIKVGEEVVTTAESTYYTYNVDDDGNEIPNTRTKTSSESVTTREKKYYDATGKLVASEETVNGDTTYYVYEGTTKVEKTQAEFNEAVQGLAVEPGNKQELGSESAVDSSKLSPLAIQVENKKGTELPSTGGIGTTIFYIVGAILVLGAGIMLVTRRRMTAE